MTSVSTPEEPIADKEGFIPMEASQLFSDTNIQRARFAMDEEEEHERSLPVVALGILIVVALIASVFLLHIRFDFNNVAPAPASKTEEARQELAVLAHRIHNQADMLGTDKPYAMISSHAQLWDEHLGGVWLPWPDGVVPSGHANPVLETEAPSNTSNETLAADIGALSTKALASSSLFTGEERSFTIRLALDARLCQAFLAEHTGMPVPPSPEANIDEIARILPDSSSLIRLDAARQWLEKDAGLIPQANRSVVSARIEAITALEEAMLAQGVKDTRSAVAAFPQDEKATTVLALNNICNVILLHSGQATEQQSEAIVNYLYSLYITNDERAHADIF